MADDFFDFIQPFFVRHKVVDGDESAGFVVARKSLAFEIFQLIASAFGATNDLEGTLIDRVDFACAGFIHDYDISVGLNVDDLMLHVEAFFDGGVDSLCSCE